MEEVITKEEFNRLMKIKGQVRGSVLESDLSFILQEKGQEGVKLIEGKLKELGYPLKHKEIKATVFYPVGLKAVVHLLVEKLFNFDEKKLEEMGARATKYPSIIRLLLQYFHLVSLNIFKKNATKAWRIHYTIGELIVVELDGEKRICRARIKNFNVHPTFCSYLKGSFIEGFKMLVKSSKITVDEVKCAHKDGEYHEFVIKW